MKTRAYEALKRLIVSGSIEPGTFLSERQLAKQLGMSNTPVRTALGRLEAEGFIVISPQQGIVVRDLSIKEIVDHYEIRDALESYVHRKLAGQLDAGQIALVHANLEAQRLSLESKDHDRNVELDARFHLMFCEFLGNDQIRNAMLQQFDKIYRAILSIARTDPSRVVHSYREHTEIAEALIVGDAERAVASLAEHLQIGRNCILSPRGLQGRNFRDGAIESLAGGGLGGPR